MQTEAERPPALPQPAHRYDGVAKVTGTAKYAAEFKEPFAKKDLVYAFVVQATIANGTVTAMDTKEAERAPGVIAVLTPFNAPKLQPGPPKPPGKRSLSVLQDAEVHYNGQPIGVVVARSLTEAMQGARLLKIEYDEQPAKLDFLGRLNEARPPKNPGKDPAKKTRGDLDAAMNKGTVRVDETYTTPLQNHNPMEPHATVAWWEDDKLTVYDSTQYITGDRMSLATALHIPLDHVHVMDPYVGGGFGCKGSTWSHVVLAAMAARIVQRPVQLALERTQMFGPVGARPSTVNRIKLAATSDGRLTVIQQDAKMTTSMMEDFVEPVVVPARILYASEANETSSAMVEMNYGVATFMRAPGESSGTAVLEIAMDELAERLGMDPVELRVVNYADRNPDEDKPWSSKHLRECYERGAKRFGWAKRSKTPGRMREGDNLIGYGMATATYPANRSAAMAVVRLMPDGRVFVGSGTQDLGTGMYTIMAQTAAQVLGMDVKLMDVKLGDSTLPKAPVSGGSQSAASVCPAVEDAAKQAKLKAAAMAVADAGSPVHGAATTEVEVDGGRVFLKQDKAKGEEVTALIARNGGKPIEAEGSAEPGEDKTATTQQSFGAVFAEVAVDKDTHTVKVRRVVAVYDIGTLLNDKTGINQLQGGIVWGVGFALTEETHVDPVVGRAVNENLAEYHVPVNADIGELDVSVLNIPDLKFNPMGARGIGEIGITGAAAAVANAVYNATGRRVRKYPITPDKLMA
ncbi:MAG TPA: xanthine dehydrogenase family protein molybdopterin-binding subunit [Acidobacteriaceae bacterium]|jgi:xanthine dehydrogenase YagR molybdenum-binding subunit|nr:xanthine dehydrogenase family protein molybdopterin-binding subunit [Acidobacteriaceae bacterium]